MNYNDTYYLMSPNYEIENEAFHVVPTEATAQRRFHYRELVYGEVSVKFNAKTDDFLSLDPMMLFCIPSFIVSKDLKIIIDDHIYGGKLYPAVVEFQNKSSSDFYLINIYQELDCWDRNSSLYKQKDPDYYPRVYKYKLDSTILDKIPENERLIFKMGGTDLSSIFIHESLKIKLENVLKNIKFLKVSEYEFGDEF
ncbi:hypothetical protein M1D72_06360 [Vibrio sp. AK197]